MKYLLSILLCLGCFSGFGQRGFAFTQITTADATGLASNMVSSLYQDDKGYIWVGTANGLQRFDGNKFVQFGSEKGTGNMPHANISQIVPADSGRLILLMPNIGEIGIFNPADFSYKKIMIIAAETLSPRSQMRIWKFSTGKIYLAINKYGILNYNPATNRFEDTQPFPFPHEWDPYLSGVFEDVAKQQVWFACDSGLCVYDRASGGLWNRYNNPKHFAVLDNPLLREHVTQIYIDRHRRTWVFGWPRWNVFKQYKLVFDSTGNMLKSDTIGLNTGTEGFTAYDHFFESREGMLWIYGSGVLYNYDSATGMFVLNKANAAANQIGISYNDVNHLMQDKDGSLWVATDQGLYFTSFESGSNSVINILINEPNQHLNITDMLETADGQLWFGTRGNGVKSIDSTFRKIPNAVYNDPLPASWTPAQRADSRFIWSMCRGDGNDIWLGCNYGVLLIHNTLTKKTKYLFPPECNTSTINFIAQDKLGAMWLGTRNGTVIKYINGGFKIMAEIGTAINKIFIDKSNLVWVSTIGKGLFALDNSNGQVVQRYTRGDGPDGLYANTGSDIEQLNDSIIVFGAGALNFINKRSGLVKIFQFEDGLPSNNVERLRMDDLGFLWIITANGLCRYNPGNNRVTPYGPKDGIVIAEQTNAADYFTRSGYVVFTGSNTVLMLKPSAFIKTQRPPDVTITDFKVFNHYIPIDSLLRSPQLKLKPDENSFSIYFSSLSYMQRDKLTYYYKMEGVDKTWIRADRSYYANYSLMPPGSYTFKIYSENIEGIPSKNITELRLFIKPPFWKTLWFLSAVIFAIALLAYFVHDMRIKRLIAVETLRQRVARDLHDDMGSTLSTINILSSMAKAKMNTDKIRTSEYLSKISENSQRMMEAMDDIIWSIKPSNDSMARIAARMREFATSVLEAKDIDIKFDLKEEVYEVKLNMEARRDFFLVFKEAVNNAAKYSNATTVCVTVAMDSGRLVLVVKDNGRGFDMNDDNDGNGLGNMRKRTDHMHGKLSIRSKKGEGTVVTVIIPVYK